MSRHTLLILLSIAVLFSSALIAVPTISAVSPANDAFRRTWERTDQPVLTGQATRTWMWAPEAFTDELTEPYAESPGGQRQVQYFDKARMEITHPDTGDPSSIWYVTNGLLVVEMVTGQMQVGDAEFEDRGAAEVNVAGDQGVDVGPTYASFAAVLDAPAYPPGTTYMARLARDGTVTDDPSLEDLGITSVIIDDVTQHSIATPFWEFMGSSGTVYEDGAYIEDQLFENSYFATGRPISEAYWAEVQIAGTPRLVLMQCFERRCLTFTPGNPEGFVVEAGNVGQHYYAWRYGSAPPEPEPEPTPPPTPEPTPPPSSDDESFGDGIWIVGEDIEPGLYRNNNTTELCYWARLSGPGGTLDEINANGLSRYRELVDIKPTDYAFESEDCGTWSTDLSPMTESPTAGFGDGEFFVGTEVAPGLWRNSDSSETCYWERLSGFGGTLDEINANNIADVLHVVEIEPSDVGFTSSRCGTWALNTGPVTSSPTADLTGGTYIVGVDIQAGVWETDSTPEGCYWARLDGFSGELGDIKDNDFIDEDQASSLSLRVRVSSSDAGFFADDDCGTWRYTGS